MPLAPGSRLGPFDILSPIGAGGMGEVYRAKDTKLKREVALKVLPDSFASDPERMARFQREAELMRPGYRSRRRAPAASARCVHPAATRLRDGFAV
jgi:serine/threonine protein kinase